MDNIQERLKKWAEDTLSFYKEQVENCPADKAYSFYTQSNLYNSHGAKLLIVGVNPGSGCLYNEWEDKDIVDADYLLKGNKCFHGKSNQEVLNILSTEYDSKKKRNGWHLYHRMRNILYHGDIDSIMSDVTQFSLINLILFASNHISDLPRNIDLVKCTELTLRLIDIINPEVIVLLGSDCKDQFERATRQKFTPLVDGSVGYCRYNEKNYFSIKHTAYCYTNEEMQVVGKILGHALDQRPISREIIQDKFHHEISQYHDRKNSKSPVRTSVNIDRLCVLSHLSSFCSDEMHLQLNKDNDSWSRYCIPGTEYQLRVVAQKSEKQKQYIAIHCDQRDELLKLQSEPLFHQFAVEGPLLKLQFSQLGKSTDNIINNGKLRIREIVQYFANK